MPPLDLTGLQPLDASGLTEMDDNQGLDTTGLTALDTSGLVPAGDSMLEEVGQNVAEFGKGIPAGAGRTVGTAFKGMGATLQTASAELRPFLEELGQVDGYTIEQVADLRKRASETLSPGERFTFQSALSDIMEDPGLAGTIRAELGRSVKDSGLYKAGEAVEKASDILPAAKGYEDSIGRGLGEGVGSVVAGAGVSLATGPLASAALFTFAGAGEAAERAIKDGATEDQIVEAARLGLLPGLTDSVPVETLLGRIPVPGGKVVQVAAEQLPAALKAVGRVGWQAFIEGVQEGGQQFLQNLIAREVYKPGQSLTEDVLPEGGMGAGVGAITETGRQVVERLVGRRRVAQQMANLSPDDIDSPIPNDLIAEGRAIVEAGGVPATPAPVVHDTSIAAEPTAPTLDTTGLIDAPQVAQAPAFDTSGLTPSQEIADEVRDAQEIASIEEAPPLVQDEARSEEAAAAPDLRERPAGTSVEPTASPAASVGPDPETPVPPAATAALPAAAGDPDALFVQIGDKRYEVASLQQASETFGAARDRAFREGAGSEDLPRALVVDGAGNVVGRIAQNGRIFAPDAKTGDKPIYDTATDEQRAAGRARADEYARQARDDTGETFKGIAVDKPAKELTDEEMATLTAADPAGMDRRNAELGKYESDPRFLAPAKNAKGQRIGAFGMAAWQTDYNLVRDYLRDGTLSERGARVDRYAKKLGEQMRATNPNVTDQAALKSAYRVVSAAETGRYNDVLHPDNKNSRALFEEITGVKLPKGVAATKVLFDSKPFLEEDGTRLKAAAAEPESQRQLKEKMAAKRPKPLYASRSVTNGADIVAWARTQGFTTTLPAEDMHVTVAYSRDALDWNAAGEASPAERVAGGARAVEKLGDKGAVVLRFDSPALADRWQKFRDAGASWDYEGYKPHITITYEGGDVDLSKVEPYKGPLVFGAETREALDTDAADKVREVPAASDSRNEPDGAKVDAQEDSDGVQDPVPGSDADTGAADVQRTPSQRDAGRARSAESDGSRAAVRGSDGERAEAAERPAQESGRDQGSRGAGAQDADRVPERDRKRAGADPGVKGENFTIDVGALKEGRGWKQKAQDNIRAIELMRQIEAEGRPATRAEQEQLALYVGWGGIKGAFPDTKGSYGEGFAEIGAKLKDLLTETEYATARRSIQYAHYTSETIVRSMWRMATRLGFKGGKVFEPGMGVGNFAGMMPTDVAQATTYNGLELDHTTARIARLLYPQWGVRRDDFTKAPLPKDTYDLVIGNPPFADITIKSDPEYAKRSFLLHDYFFAKSLDAVRPGGLLIFISSAGTMNKIDTGAREYLADRADLVGAIRLPGDAFEKNAGTSVTTDIIILRKRLDAETAGDRTWTETVEMTLPNKDGKQIEGQVNRYFAEHADMVLGEQGFFDKLYQNRYGVRAIKGEDLAGRIDDAINALPVRVMTEAQTPTEKAEIDFGTAERKEGSFYQDGGGRLMQRRSGVGHPVQARGKGVEGGMTAGQIERIKGLVPIRDALRAVYDADLKSDTENADKARKRLNAAYDSFVKTFGPINKAEISYRRPNAIQQESARSEAREEARFNGSPFSEGSFDPTDMVRAGKTLSEISRARKMLKEQYAKEGTPWDEGTFDPDDMPDIVIDKRPNIDPFMDDPESYRLRAIEKYDDATGEAKKSLVFFENVVTRETQPKISSVGDAMLYVLNKRGRLDIAEVAQAAGLSESEAIDKLGEAIFKVPGTENTWETKDAYLSGNVRQKLRIARAAAEQEPTLQRNVDALEAAQPAPLPPSEISANLGMPWIPTAVVEQFGKDIGLERVKVSYLPALAQWFVEGDEQSAAARTTWGTSDRSAPKLISDALNRQDPKIYDTVYEDGKRKEVLNPTATQAAQDKVREIKEKFADWIWSDTARSDELAQLYNEQYNNLVVREFDGSYLTTPGIASTWSWRPHQKRVIARIIQSGNTYVAHAVGAGKTSEMIAAGMEMRRLGLVRKPMYAVPNHMLGQFTKEFYEQYPTARIAVADERRFHTDRRKQFVADVATDDLDAIIITHSAFGLIPVSVEFQDSMIMEQIDQYRDLLGDIDKSDPDTRITRRRLENAVEKLEQRLSGKAKKQDSVFTFEEMGVDFLFVDEAHLFRKLDFATKMTSVKGISPEGSKAAFDLYVKARYLETVNPGRTLVLASGTPVTNTMAELYTVSRYLQGRELAERGLAHFDAWAGAFGDTVAQLEQNAAGGYQPVTRFAKFVNVPELSAMVRQVMDVVTSRQLEQYVVRPKLKGGKREMHLAEKTPALEAFQNDLARRMKAIAQRKGPPKKGDDILLSVINDGRHAAIDMRLVDPTLPNDKGSKLNLLLDKVHRTWKETKRQPFHKPDPANGRYEEKPFDTGPATQMIFANLGIGDGRAFNVSKYLVTELNRRGVPKSEIAEIKDFTTHVAKQRLFNDMNEGKVRVLIGSTAKMATGVNAQRRLYAIHNLDPLWYPADDEQRNGRGLRQGNLNPEIEINDYSTKGTYDSTMWGMMETKARFIQGFFEGDPSLRDMEDLGEASQYEQAKAITTADPRLIKLTEFKQDLEKARRRKAAFDREQYAVRERVADAKRQISRSEERIPQIEQDIARRQDTTGDTFTAKAGAKTYDERTAFGDALLGQIETMKEAKRPRDKVKIGEIGGFDIKATIYDGGTKKVPEWKAYLMIERTAEFITDVKVSTSAVGQARSLENALQSFESDLAYQKSRLEAARKAVVEFTPQMGKEFTGQDDIARLAEEVRKLESQLGSETAKEEGQILAYIPTPIDEMEVSTRAPREPARDMALLARTAPVDAPAGAISEMELRAVVDKVTKNWRRGVHIRMVDTFAELPEDLRAQAKSGDEDGGVSGVFHGGIVYLVRDTIPNAREAEKTLFHEAYGHAGFDLIFGDDVREKMLALYEAIGGEAGLDRMAARHGIDLAAYKDAYANEDTAFRNSVLAEELLTHIARDNRPGVVRAFKEMIGAVRAWLRAHGFSRLGLVSESELIHLLKRARQAVETGKGAVARPLPPRDEAGRFVSDEAKFSLAPRTPRPAGANDSVVFDDRAQEKRWQEARKGAAAQENLLTRTAAWWDVIATGFSRHFIHLPNTKRFADAREQLRKLEAAPQASKEHVVRILRDITDGMTQADLDIFTRKVVLDDLSWEAEQDREIPFGMSAEDVTRELAKVDAIIGRRPDLAEAVRQRKMIVREVADELVRAGVLSKEQIKNPAYYRHQVLDYARAQVAYAKTPGRRLRSPHWARRMGSQLDINANLLEAEFDWLHKAFTDIETAKTIDWLKRSEHNVRKDVIAQAKASNDGLMQAIMDREDAVGALTTAQMDEFKKRIAIGLSHVRKAIDDGALFVPEEFEAAARRLTQEADNEASIFPFLAWIMDNDEAGSMGAAMAFKAVSQRREFIRQTLGDRYADPMDVGSLVKRFAPEGYVVWQPDEGKLLFTAKTLPEHVIDRMLQRISETTFGPISQEELRGALGAVRSMMAVGGNKYEMVIPEELAATLNSLRDEHADSLIEATLEQPLRWWKRWVLINPRRVIKYNLNNLSGDLDAVIAGNPKALRYMGQAIRELHQVMIKRQEPTERYKEAVARGVFDSGLTIQEIPDINILSEFEGLIQQEPAVKRFTLGPFVKIWRALQRYTQFRENWLRYAAYLDYAERLEAGETMKSIGYGAANAEMVDAIKDKKDKAALLARELVGDYGAVSHFGQGIRRKVIPFWSWVEINTKRYWRLGINAFGQGVGQGAKTAGTIGALKGAKLTAYLFLRMAALYMAVTIWNNLVFGDDEDELDPEERARLHLLLGRGSDGQIRMLRIQGAFGDFLAWFGFEDVVDAFHEIEAGRGGLGDILKAIAKAPINKIAQGITPVIKVPVESLTGNTFFPDVFRPMPVRDGWRNFARTFSVEHEYDLAAGNPSRGYGRSLADAVIYQRDVGENAYMRARSMVYDWLRKEKGQDGTSSFSTPRSEALHEWRLAKRYGDAPAAERARDKMRELGIKDSDLEASIRRAHPLGPVAIKDRGKFRATLTTDEEKVLDQAIDWYRETYAK